MFGRIMVFMCYFRKGSSMGHKMLGTCPLTASSSLCSNGGEDASGKFLCITKSDIPIFHLL